MADGQAPVAPEKRPSLTKAILVPMPLPSTAAIKVSMWAYPGSPWGPRSGSPPRPPVNLIVKHGLPGVILGIVYPGRAGKDPGVLFHRAELDDGAIRPNVAMEHRQAALLVEGVSHRTDDLRIEVFRRAMSPMLPNIPWA